jgi:2-phospho-L-lactate guanylyltransferase
MSAATLATTLATTLAIVPVKELARAKSRLGSALTPVARRRLVLTMLEDVLALLSRFEAVAGIVVVTPDADVAALARTLGADTLNEDKPHGLNAAIRAGLGHARSRNFSRALVIPADVPLATSSEVLAVLSSAPAGGRPQTVLVPSEDGEGTNALLLAPPDAMQPAFGEGSFVRHVAQAVALGLDFRVLRLPGLAADIDEPRDLARLAAVERYAFLRESEGRGLETER